mmetsp:Transcript_20026/g.40664  ORF Transcript_20026/g.40664 Transcript_20026/m.40664 type:complete len:517 (-) Transcript_20026:44-1594(-)
MGCASGVPRGSAAGSHQHTAEDVGRDAPPVGYFWFLRASDIMRSSEAQLPQMQELRGRGWLVKQDMNFSDACRGVYRGETLVVSHRWEQPDSPDPSGAQVTEIRAYLRAHPGIKFVWYDFWCMAQGKRTDAEKAEFKAMLKQINILYLGATVLILLELSYISRFWTQFEAWLSMQCPTPKGLVPCNLTNAQRRCQIKCIHNAPPEMEDILLNMWYSKSPEDAHDILSKADVTVTNASDKEEQLPKLRMINAEVMQVDGLQEDQQELKTRASKARCKSLLGELFEGELVSPSELEMECHDLLIFKGRTCKARLLHYAVWVSGEANEEDAATTRLVLEARADPRSAMSYPTPTGHVRLEAFHLAVGMGWLSCAKALVETEGAAELVNAYAELNGSAFYTPLHEAAFAGRTECVAWLLAEQADPDLLNKDRRTPLSLAIAIGGQATRHESRDKIVLLLLKHKARVDVTGGPGERGKLLLEFAACDAPKFPRHLLHLLAPSQDGTSLFPEQLDSLLGTDG